MAESIIHRDVKIYLIGPMQESLSILDAARKMTKRAERLALLVGDPGSGKSTSCQIYAERHPREVCYLQIPAKVLLKPGTIIKLLQNALEINAPITQDNHRACEQIIRQLRERPRMLLLDEADRLPYNLVDLVRYIHDESGCRVVFAGLPRVEKHFRLDPVLGDRVGLRYQLKPLQRKDLREIEVLNGLDEDVLDAVYDITNGNMRRIMVLTSHIEAMLSNNTAITAKRIERAAGYLTVRGVA